MIDERIKWDEIIFLGFGNETGDKRMDNKFSRASKGKMCFSFCALKEENEIKEERWGVICKWSRREDEFFVMCIKGREWNKRRKMRSHL